MANKTWNQGKPDSKPYKLVELSLDWLTVISTIVTPPKQVWRGALTKNMSLCSQFCPCSSLLTAHWINRLPSERCLGRPWLALALSSHLISFSYILKLTKFLYWSSKTLGSFMPLSNQTCFLNLHVLTQTLLYLSLSKFRYIFLIFSVTLEVAIFLKVSFCTLMCFFTYLSFH